jgi:exosortase D (VPLPA-CTERM-specific)
MMMHETLPKSDRLAPGSVFSNSPGMPGSMAAVALWAVALLLAVVCFWPGLAHVVTQWQREEFSYGYIVWPIAAWLVWNGLCDRPRDAFGGVWAGPMLIAFAIAVAGVGTFAGMLPLVYYGFVVGCYGLVLCRVGWRGFLALLGPLSLLWFGYPLPSTLYTKVAVFMQMISSEIGAWVIKLLGIPVLLEGNVIDLGVYQLQVAEACNGLRYLFPIACFAYIVAYTYRGPFWQRVLIVVASAPITILINSVRIAITGVLVKYAGVEMAEGFLHWFEGFAVAIAGLFLLYLVVAVLVRVNRQPGGVWPNIRFELFWPVRRPPGWLFAGISPPLIAAVALLAAGVGAFAAMPQREAVAPARQPLISFPMQLGDWQGNEHALEARYLNILRLDDYLVADYTLRGSGSPVELYVAYYAAQDNTAAIHSPSVCIPAGGWEISGFQRISVPLRNAQSVPVNRTIITKGLDRRLVYYWFEQRGRQLTNEYAIKLTNAIDGVMMGRTDGALIRVTTPIIALEPPDAADRRLQAFLDEAYPLIRPHVPD